MGPSTSGFLEAYEAYWRPLLGQTASLRLTGVTHFMGHVKML